MVPAGNEVAARAGVIAMVKAADSAAGISRDFITGSNGERRTVAATSHRWIELPGDQLAFFGTITNR
jgi:hypothetical protein